MLLRTNKLTFSTATQFTPRPLVNKGIIYAPDYVVNAGGLINVSTEISGMSGEEAMKLAQGIYDTTLNIFKVAKEQSIPTYAAANMIAEKRINEARASK